VGHDVVAEMPDGVLSVVLEREHHEIDSGIGAFIEKLDGGSVQHT
jgi:hypothetical protein